MGTKSLEDGQGVSKPPSNTQQITTNHCRLPRYEAAQSWTDTLLLWPDYFRQDQVSGVYCLKVEGWVPGAGGRGNGESLFSGDRASVWADENVLEMGGGDGCTTV